jgi:hypothetical protein
LFRKAASTISIHCPKCVLSIRRQNGPLTYIPIGRQLLRVNTKRFSAPMLLLPSPGICHTKSVIVNLSDLLEWHPFHFWVCENDEQPSKCANRSIKPKGTTGRHALHHCEECRCNDEVCAPARNGVLFSTSEWVISSGVGKKRTIIVPKARTSIGSNSVPTQPIVATPEAKKAT